MRLRLFPLFLTIMAAIVLAAPNALASHDDKYQGRQHGYEHGYRDGFQHGREDRERHVAFKFDTEDYKHGDRGYDKYMGDHDEYKQGYRRGYQNGYNDAFYGRPGRFAEIYGRVDSPEDVRYRDSYSFEPALEAIPTLRLILDTVTGYKPGRKISET